ncbi:MAG: hypothetical protein JW776_06685 [Candidatus Lokiarchaeota archaeon]|nr:hypothetical protein [Candidatus Lokiarchaeota archaeon]
MNQGKKLITLKIDEEDLNRWNAFCKEKNLSRTELIRLSVGEYIQDIKKDKLLLHYTRILTTKIEQNFDEIKDMLREKFTQEGI